LIVFDYNDLSIDRCHRSTRYKPETNICCGSFEWYRCEIFWDTF